jgi:hypothetical protein
VLHGQNDDKTTAYSSLLSDDAAVYEVIIEDVKPREWEQYLIHKGDSPQRPVFNVSLPLKGELCSGNTLLLRRMDCANRGSSPLGDNYALRVKVCH